MSINKGVKEDPKRDIEEDHKREMHEKRQLADMFRFLMGQENQTEFAKKIGVNQSAISGYLNPSPTSRFPEKPTDRLIVKYLKTNCHPKWSLQHFQTYLESSLPFETFAAQLVRQIEQIKTDDVEKFVNNLSTEELINVVSLASGRLKKNCFPVLSCA